ncbi:MAG: HAD-IB family hydrolase [Naasia sp.]
MTAVAPAVAFFDVDNTLLRGASLFHLGRGAHKAGFISSMQIARFAITAARFTARGEKTRDLDRARREALRIIRGRRTSDLRDLAPLVYRRYIEATVWPETRALVTEHRSLGHEVWLVTTTPDFLAEEIAERLGATGAVGTRLEEVDGRFTGEVDGAIMHGPEKAAAARTIAERAGAGLDDCFAYSDSINDVPLLSLCGNRVAVNPDSRLRRHATTQGWTQMRLDPQGVRAERRRLRREARE